MAKQVMFRAQWKPRDTFKNGMWEVVIGDTITSVADEDFTNLAKQMNRLVVPPGKKCDMSFVLTSQALGNKTVDLKGVDSEVAEALKQYVNDLVECHRQAVENQAGVAHDGQNKMGPDWT